MKTAQTRPHVYLFCNHGFGLPFIVHALRCAQLSGRLTIVNSPTPGSRHSALFLRRILLSLRFTALKMHIRGLAAMNCARILLSDDVNSPKFRESIPPDAHGIVAGFGQIFRKSSIDSFRSLVNFHPSLLPFYRGPIPSYWVLQNREEMTGYTLHRITERIDSGEVLFQEKVSCAGCRSPEALDHRVAIEAQGAFDRYLNHILNDESWESVQLPAGAIYKAPIDYGSRPDL